MLLGRLCCGGCQIILKADDDVKISKYNTVVHKNCSIVLPDPVKDEGEADYIIDKYLQK